MISDFLQTIAGASCDSWWLACFELAPEPPPSWPGLTRAIHAAASETSADSAADSRKNLINNAF